MNRSHDVTDPRNIKPPLVEVGVIGWLRKNLFNGVLNSLLSLAIIALLVWLVPSFLYWVLIDSFWTAPGTVCQEAGQGACWSVVISNFRYILFGFYPTEEQWRPICAMVLLFLLVFYSRNRNHWHKPLLYCWLAGLIVMGGLMAGGIFGLAAVETAKWSGLPLTLLLSLFGMTAAYPLGVLLALGRQSKMPAIKSLCVVYIELIRGVPLISLLFMSAVMFPLFLPEGVTIDKILRAQVAIILFTAAYIAEVVRGGLQAINKGQFEAAESLGLNYYQKMRLIILPQALKIVIPPSVGILISAFKDTSLVVIIALYDILNTMKSTLSHPEWMGYSTEAYLFIAAVYFFFCYALSTYARRLEKELDYKT